MNAASIIETFGRGIPATLDTSMIVDVCAYLRSTQSPAVLELNSRGEMKGVLSHRDIIHASGRLGSSVMQMMAQELMRDQVPVCQSGDGLIELLELVTETGSDFALVAEGSQIKGIVSSHDLTELLVTALGGGDAEAQTAESAVETRSTDAAGTGADHASRGSTAASASAATSGHDRGAGLAASASASAARAASAGAGSAAGGGDAAAIAACAIRRAGRWLATAGPVPGFGRTTGACRTSTSAGAVAIAVPVGA